MCIIINSECAGNRKICSTMCTNCVTILHLNWCQVCQCSVVSVERKVSQHNETKICVYWANFLVKPLNYQDKLHVCTF